MEAILDLLISTVQKIYNINSNFGNSTLYFRLAEEFISGRGIKNAMSFEKMNGRGDRDLAIIGSQQVEVSEADDAHIRRKIDKVILSILVWVYFLQILDKSALGYGVIFGLKEDVKLHGNQYSLFGSIAAIAQLAWQPFSMVLIVKVPHRILMPSLVLGWGISQAAMAGCHTLTGLMTTRFLLGLF
ncbi:hypothetical protein CISG_05200 [Coccidioides immitis RMSCC 3703]|uniref:Major facilitator superfamily (MFS) profile domain-containing protein n=1 Tax=Coccidioides immitis RMSCC 3703 TaxID=454286 RepID=A0A0J8QWS9_COCIT|nr:hypothetical protein CISG_05200 [Coccidioides immitis RMSCC 3703]